MALCIDCDELIEAAQEHLAAETRAERIASNLRASGLPVAYRSGERDWRQVSLLVPDVAAILGHLAAGAKGLFLWGPAGSFKTSTAASLLAEKIRAGESGRYVFVPDLFTELYAIYAAKDERSRADVMDRYGYAPYLVLDDLGKERPTEHAASVLMEIIDRRYRMGGAGWMIVTSNYSVPDLGGRFDVAGEAWSQPIIRRLSEMCLSVPMGVR